MNKRLVNDLGDYGSDMEQFAALMNAGAVVAEEMNLKVVLP